MLPASGGTKAQRQEGTEGTRGKGTKAHRHMGTKGRPGQTQLRALPWGRHVVPPCLRAYVPLPGAGSSYTQDALLGISRLFPAPPEQMYTHLIQRLRDNITSVYMGNTAAVDRVIACLLA